VTSFVYLTAERLREIENEVKELKTNGRKEMANSIAEARSFGDLSENAEYDAAKEAQGMLELKISKLQQLIMNARIIDESKMDTTKVLLLSKVKIKNLNNGATMNYVLVPEKEADLKSGKISVNSPIAKGLLGKTIGDQAEITVPAGVMTFEIVEVSR